ncbi:MAG: FHA domain-containing protein [Verrucomicrobia bacterium]|nr:FHA domain-containing protein [Verrucomicrobiota bacterium]
MDDQSASGGKGVVAAVRPQPRARWFGSHRNEVVPPSPELGASLFLRTRSATGELSLRLVKSGEGSIAIGPGAFALFLRVYAEPRSAELTFPGIAQDVEGKGLDVSLVGQLSVTDARAFLGCGIADLVVSSTPLGMAALQPWIAQRIAPSVHDVLAPLAALHPFSQLQSRQVLPLAWWQNQLGRWLSPLGLSIELTEVRLECAEADRAEAAQKAMAALEERARLAGQLRDAGLRAARLEVEGRAKLHEWEKELALLAAEKTAARIKLEHDLRATELAYRKNLLDAEAEVHAAEREAAEAEARHLTLLAQLRQQAADLELARLEREHAGDLARERRVAEQRLVLARLELDLQKIQFDQQVQAQAFAREAERQRLFFQAELEELKKDAEFKGKPKDAEREELLRQAQGHFHRATTVHTAACNHAAKAQVDPPRVAVLSAESRPACFEVRRPWLFFGRREPCHLLLPSLRASAHHGAVAQVSRAWMVVDHASRNGSSLNGELINQQHLLNGDILRAGDCWLVFALRPEQEWRPIAGASSATRTTAASGATIPMAALPPTMTFRPAPAPGPMASALVELISASGETASSDGGPILIGNSSLCTLRLDGGGAARFHAMVFWQAVGDARGHAAHAGVFIEDLHSGKGLLHNGQPIKRAQLRDRDLLEIGGYRLTVSFHGNVLAHAQSLLQRPPVEADWAITCVEGPCAGKSLRLKAEQDSFLIGSGPACDLLLPAPGISPRHTELCFSSQPDAGGRQQRGWTITAVDSARGAQLNGKELAPKQPARLRPADVLRLGKDHSRCYLLVHYHR